MTDTRVGKILSVGAKMVCQWYLKILTIIVVWIDRKLRGNRPVDSKRSVARLKLEWIVGLCTVLIRVGHGLQDTN